MFRHVGIVVNDLKNMLYFYSEILGMEIISDEIEGGEFLNKILGYNDISGRIIKLGKNEKTIVELLDFNEKENQSNKTLINNFFVMSEPQISVNKKFKVCFCKDPEGNFVEIVEIL